MKLFESTWRDGYQYFERYYDTDLNKSVKKRIDLPAEWYEPCSRGSYTNIIDESIKLEKKQGRVKDGRHHAGFLDPMYRNIRDNYWNKDKYNSSPRVWMLDIETRVGTCSKGFPVPNKAAEPISLMQFYDNKEKTLFVLGVRDWVHQSDYKFDYDVKYVKCRDEMHLIDVFLNIFGKLDPLIVYAWNGNGFDFPYIYNRLKNLGIDVDRLSVHGSTALNEREFQGSTTYKLQSDGHFFIDLMEIYKKFTFKPVPNYSLDTIAELELKQNKIQHTEYAAFDDFYTGKYIIPTNPTESQKNSKIYKAAILGNWSEVKELAHSEFVYYGIIDTYLIQRIDSKKNFTDLLITISKMMGVQISDAVGTVKPWSQYIMNKSMLNRRVIPPRSEHDQPHVVGGYVRDVERGKHEWVLSADVNSMYPLLGMVGFNMSPETFVPKNKMPPQLRDMVLSYFNDQDEAARLELSNDVKEQVQDILKSNKMSLGINGAVFNCEKLGMIPEMVSEIYVDRKKAKKTQFKYEERKLLLGELLKKRQNKE